MERSSRAGKGRLYKIIIILIIAFTAASCGSPVGTIGGYGDNDLLWTVPNRVSYDINDLFRRNTDYQVFVSYHGVIQYVPNDQVKVAIVEEPDFSYNPEYLEYIDEDYPLRTKGRKLIMVEYRGLNAEYSIEVRDPYGLGGGTGGNGSDGTGIHIDWVVDWETPVNLLP